MLNAFVPRGAFAIAVAAFALPIVRISVLGVGEKLLGFHFVVPGTEYGSLPMMLALCALVVGAAASVRPDRTGRSIAAVSGVVACGMLLVTFTGMAGAVQRSAPMGGIEIAAPFYLAIILPIVAVIALFLLPQQAEYGPAAAAIEGQASKTTSYLSAG